MVVSPTKNIKPFNTVELDSRLTRLPRQDNTYSRKIERSNMRNVSSSMNQIGGVKKRKIENSSGYQRNSRLGRSQAAPIASKRSMPHNPLLDSQAYGGDDDDDQNFSRRMDEFTTIQTTQAGP